MNPTAHDLKQIEKLVEGVAMSRSMVIRGRAVWAWRKLSPVQRKRVEAETRCETLDAELLDRILDAKNAATNAVRVQRQVG